MKIDEEIKKLTRELNFAEDTHPDYLPPALKDLLALVLTSHARLEFGLEGIIKGEIVKKAGASAHSETLRSVVWEMNDLFERISFKEKMGIVKGYKDAELTVLLESCRKVNKYRNEFAHFDGQKLRSKYSANDPKVKVNRRNLLRCLVKAEKDLNYYFASNIAKNKIKNQNKEK